MYCEDGQEVLDSTLQAFRLAEAVNLPVMIVLDAFYLSHTYEPVDVPSQRRSTGFCHPSCRNFNWIRLIPAASAPWWLPAITWKCAIILRWRWRRPWAVSMRLTRHLPAQFNRRYGPVEAIDCEDATLSLSPRDSDEHLPHRAPGPAGPGEKVGILKLKLFRPFPLRKSAKNSNRQRRWAVVDRNFSFGASGIFAQEVRAALCNMPDHPPVFGLCGRHRRPGCDA